MGTRIQAEHLEEQDYRGDRFKDFKAIDNNGVEVSLKGNNDLLCFSKLDMLKDIHKEYYVAGSDVCETNTFNGTAISQREYKMQAIVYEMNKIGVQNDCTGSAYRQGTGARVGATTPGGAPWMLSRPCGATATVNSRRKRTSLRAASR